MKIYPSSIAFISLLLNASCIYSNRGNETRYVPPDEMAQSIGERTAIADMLNGHMRFYTDGSNGVNIDILPKEILNYCNENKIDVIFLNIANSGVDVDFNEFTQGYSRIFNSKHWKLALMIQKNNETNPIIKGTAQQVDAPEPATMVSPALQTPQRPAR